MAYPYSIPTTVLLLVAGASYGRPAEPWTYNDLLVKSDLVVIAHAIETKLTAHDDSPPDVGTINGRPLASFLERVETTFNVRAVVRGKFDEESVTVVHFRWNQQEIDKELRRSDLFGFAPVDAPSLVVFPNQLQQLNELADEERAGRRTDLYRLDRALRVADCFLFLKRRKDGKHEPVTGQALATSSVRWLTVPSGSDPDQRSAGAETDAQLKGLLKRTQLLTLDLSVTHVTDDGLQHLKTLSQLRWLNLSGTAITDTGLKYLEGLSQLQWLNLSKEAPLLLDVPLELTARAGGTRVTDGGLVYLKELRQLKTLYLVGAEITDVGLEHLKGLNRLEWLDLSRTLVTDAGLKHLKGLNRLQQLYLQGTKVTENGVGELRQALPSCAVEFKECPVRVYRP